MEDSELKELLKQNLEVAKENNQLLKRMIRTGRVAFIFKVLVWAIILLLPILLLPYIKPIFGLIPGFTASSTNPSLFGFPSPTAVQHAIQQYQASQGN